MSNEPNNSYLVAGAIIIAGLLIAVGVFMSGDGTTPNNHENNDGEVASEDISIAPITPEDHIKGPFGAPVTIIEYSDTECPFCKNFHGVLNEIMETYPLGEVAWVYRHFPLTSIHPKAPREAHATECAAELGGNQGFWNFIDTLYEITPSNNGLDLNTLPDIAETAGLDREAFIECEDRQEHREIVESMFNDARASGGTGTPYSVFVLQEAMSPEVLEAMKTLGANFGPGGLRISTDNKRVAISGGLPVATVTGILDTLLGK